MNIQKIAQAVEESTKSGSLGTFKAPSSAFAPTTAQGAANTFERVISIALGGFTLVAALYFLFILLVAAFDWMSAGGDSSKIEKARNSITNGLIGLVILVSVYAVAGVVGSLVGIDILNPGSLILQLGPGAPEATGSAVLTP